MMVRHKLCVMVIANAALMLEFSWVRAAPATQQGGDEKDIMTRIIRLMNDSAKRLETDFDPGLDTQRVQDQILKELDEAIRFAAAQTKRSSDASRDRGDKRRMQESDSSENAARQTQPKGVASESTEQPLAPGQVTGETRLNPGPLDEVRQNWGQLPPRDREELIQGAEEKALDRFKSLIDDYYRALQEAGHDQPYQKPK